MLSVYLAMSLDGYIAGEGGDLSFLAPFEGGNEDYGYVKFLKTVDVVIMGRNTYDKVLSFGTGFPYGNKKVYVFTHRESVAAPNIIFTKQNPARLVNKLNKEGKQIYCDGGASLIDQLRKANKIDRYIISLIPTLVGKGIRLFKDAGKPERLELVRSKKYTSGIVQLEYRKP